MDELANFKNAAADLREREALLLERAHLVFAGGRTLYQARQGRHPHLHLFPSGVEPQHFACALQSATPIAPEISHFPFPVLGYYGVIDERIDLALLDGLAAEHPDWSIVIVGHCRQDRSSRSAAPTEYPLHGKTTLRKTALLFERV